MNKAGQKREKKKKFCFIAQINWYGLLMLGGLLVLILILWLIGY